MGIFANMTRRKFLRTAAASAGALAGSQFMPAQSWAGGHSGAIMPLAARSLKTLN